MLEHIRSPKDIKCLDSEETALLCEELRKKIISAVSVNGGHLGSNLGIVEAAVMLHRTLDSPRDSIIFDVSHQCYAHKLLTGRYDRFGSLRRFGGISGFTNSAESEHDLFTFGHSGSALSAALGLAQAKKLRQNDSWTAVVIGDASCSNGMVFEALNGIADKKLRLLIVINDNGMSISKNRGKLARHLSRVRTSRRYLRLKRSTEVSLKKIPVLGKPMISALKRLKHLLRFLVYKDSLFESMGLDYIGPVDGNDINSLDAVLSEAVRRDTISVIHITTEKGRGYLPAEKEKERFHATGAFDIDTGVALKSKGKGFSDEFGRLICECALRDERICAVTAAMCSGTGLDRFAQSFPDRFFDVGIAEEHALTFCCGLAKGGFKPVFAVYATFLQRCFDQLVHDCALQGADIILAIDRAGLVGADGATHHGVLDCAMLSCVPNTSIWSPSRYDELEECFDEAVSTKGISAVRYPRGSEADDPREWVRKGSYKVFVPPDGCEPCRAILTYGRLCGNAARAAEIKGGTKVIKLIKIHPFRAEEISEELEGIKHLLIAEEAMQQGCLAMQYASALREAMPRLDITAVTLGDGFVPHGTEEELMELKGLSADRLAQKL